MVIIGVIIGVAFLLMLQEGDISGSAIKAKKMNIEKTNTQTVDSFFQSLGGQKGSFEEVTSRFQGEKREDQKEMSQEGLVRCERSETGVKCVREVMIGGVMNRIETNTVNGETRVEIKQK